MTAAETLDAAAVAGAQNLLASCAGVKAGQSVLLVVEPPGAGYYDDRMGPFIAAEAARLGARPKLFWGPASCDPDRPPGELMEAIAAADHTIFLTRIGDQLRFRPLPGRGTKTMSYALDFGFLSAPFGTAPYGLFAEVAHRLSDRIGEASGYRVRCPLGTDLSMAFEGEKPAPADFTVKTFPAMILPPLSAARASGTLVLSQTLTSTYINPYEDSILPLPAPVKLTLREGEIVRIEGDPALVQRVEAQFERVAGLLGGEPMRVNSWHAGLNPTTFFSRPALSDIDRWAGVAFGSPRYLHLHMCGDAPGDICGQVFDPEISFDGEPLWSAGRLVFLDRPENQALLEVFGVGPWAFETRRDIGLKGEG